MKLPVWFFLVLLLATANGWTWHEGVKRGKLASVLRSGIISGRRSVRMGGSPASALAVWLATVISVLGGIGFSSAKAEDWAGKYFGSEGSGKSAMEFEIRGETNDWEVNGIAYFDGSARSATPDFSGELREEKEGLLIFDFSDSFENTGIMEVRKAGRDVSVKIKISKEGDTRSLAHYSERKLKRKKVVLPEWMPAGYTGGGDWPMDDESLSAEMLYLKRKWELGLLDTKSRKLVFIPHPSAEVVNAVLKKDFGLEPVPVKSVGFYELMWTKNVLEATYFIKLETEDPRFKKAALFLTRKFECEAGPQFREVSEPKGRIDTVSEPSRE